MLFLHLPQYLPLLSFHIIGPTTALSASNEPVCLWSVPVSAPDPPPKELLELKRLQIRAPKANEAVIVKQLGERFNGTMKSMASQGGSLWFDWWPLYFLFLGEQYKGGHTFKEFEAFLYLTLQGIQGREEQRGLSPTYRSTPTFCSYRSCSFQFSFSCYFFFYCSCIFFCFLLLLNMLLPQPPPDLLWLLHPHRSLPVSVHTKQIRSSKVTVNRK